MRSKFKWIFTLLVALSMQFSFAQEKTVTGVVSDKGGPLPGANVLVKSTGKGVQTDIDGKFSIKAKTGDVLVVSFSGYEIKNVAVGASNSVKVTLVETSKEIEAVVVLGYSKTRTKAENISAVTTISSETIENRPNASFLNSLQGSSPGLTILSTSGSPGSAKIDSFIRGMSSLNASTEPLFVIDGVPTNGNQFRSLNQNDIETASVLRDAAATSVYGNRGANGVIVITTKQGKYGKSLKISYDSVVGVNSLPMNNYNMSSSRQILALEKSKNVGLGATLTDAQIAAYATNTDWRDVFFGTDITQQHNLGLTFGGAQTNNYTSFGYYTQGGLVPTTDFKRFTVRNNFNGKSENERFVYGTQIALAYSKRNQLNQETNSGVNSNTIQNPLHGSVMGLPYALPNQFTNGYDLFNTIGTDFTGPNDTYVLEDILKKNSLPSWVDETSILASMNASYKITKNLTLSNKMGIDYKVNDRVFARAPWSYLALAVQSGRPGEEFGGFETMSNEKDFTFTNILNTSYSKTFGNHKINAGLYLEYMKSHYLLKTQNHSGLNPKTYSPGAGTGYVPYSSTQPDAYVSTATASKIDAGTLSYFATADYDYKEKYGFSGAIRRDASYRFIGENKWATFYSVAGRWNIDKEEFMNGSTFSMLKLRASYGTQGNQNIVAPANGTNPLFPGNNVVRDINSTGQGYDNGAGLFNAISNPYAKWEEISQLNVGLDFRLLKNKLEGNVDVYKKQTNELYSGINLSAITGTYGITGNNGKLENKGIELALKYYVVNNKDFKFDVFANASYNKSKIVEFDNADQSGDDLVNVVGGVAGQWNLIPYIGVNQSNGNLLFLDKDGNATETPDETNDRRLSGKSYLPVYQGGFGFNTDYKGFFLSTLFSWTKDVWRYDNQLRWAYDVNNIGDDNVSSDLLNAWTSDNHSNFPSLTATNTTLDSSSDRYLFDSSFLRLKNVSLGYNFPSTFLNNTFINKLRVYVQAENMLTWTKWRGFDPESLTAFYVSGYPNPKTISFGTSIQF